MTAATAATAATSRGQRTGPALPRARGTLSAALLDRLARGSGAVPEPGELDPLGEDAQLSLYVLYELHYRGFAGVDPADEWDPGLLALRRSLELPFEAVLRARVDGGHDVTAALGALLEEPIEPTGGSVYLLREGTLAQLREYVAHRSLYHLKEADPQAWVIPRLEGDAKVGLVTVEHDEYGSGRPERLHAALFATMMRALDLPDTYGHFLDAAPATTLAEVTLMSMLGLHRRLRGALVGQFALVELTSSPGSARLVRAMQRLGVPAATGFYDEHVEADAVHEQVIRRQVLTPLLAAEPDLAADVVFGIQAATVLAEDWENAVLTAWRAGRTSLRG